MPLCSTFRGCWIVPILGWVDHEIVIAAERSILRLPSSGQALKLRKARFFPTTLSWVPKDEKEIFERAELYDWKTAHLSHLKREVRSGFVFDTSLPLELRATVNKKKS